MSSLLFALLLTGRPTLQIDVLENVRKAVQAPATTKAWEETVLTGSAYFNGVDSKYKLQFSPDGPFRQSISGLLGQTFGFDGKIYWQIDRTGASRVLSFDDIDRVQALLFLLTDRWLDGNNHVNATVESRRSGEKDFRIHFKPRETGIMEVVTIDSETWLPKRAEFEIAGSKTVVDMADWKSAGPLKLPFSAKITNEGVTDRLSVESADATPKGESAVYASPTSNLTDFKFDSSIPSAVETKRAASGHVLVHPLVNGKDVGWFILDSGADTMIIDSSVADSLGLPKVGKEAVMGVGGSVQEPFRVSKEFSLGPAKISGVTFIQIDLKDLSSAFGVKLCGIVGYSHARLVAWTA